MTLAERTFTEHALPVGYSLALHRVFRSVV